MFLYETQEKPKRFFYECDKCHQTFEKRRRYKNCRVNCQNCSRNKKGSSSISLDEVKKRLFEKHGNSVSIKEETYKTVSLDAVFVDKDHGEWTTQVFGVISLGWRHPTKARQSITTAQSLTIEKYKKRLFETHKKQVKLDETTYQTYQGNKARFIDIDYGEWWAQPKSVAEGSKHPTRAIVEHPVPGRTSLDEIKTCLKNVHGDKVKLVDETAFLHKGAGQRMLFHDVDYGEWEAMIGAVIKGVRHPDRVQKEKYIPRYCTYEKHWLTDKKLICMSSYEVAFVKWCAKNKIEFDWQIPFVTPFKTQKGKSSKYYIDAYIKSGDFAGVYIEIKGYFRDESRQVKWNWFHKTYPNSEIWFQKELKERGIL